MRKISIKKVFSPCVKSVFCALLAFAIPLSAVTAASPSAAADGAPSADPGAASWYRLGFFSCAKLTPSQYVKKTTGAKLGEAKLLFHEDTHGGFLGDGSTLIVMDCAEAGDDFESSLSAWHELPVSDQLYYSLYGQRANGETEPNLDDLFVRFSIKHDKKAPIVKEGLYYLENRNSNAKSRDDEVLDYGSWNFTFAVYDRETKTLYYMEVDT